MGISRYILLSDRQLIEKIKDDDYKAFRIFYDRYKNKIYHFILSISHGNQYLAEEIVQITFIKVWDNRKKLSAELSIQNYLFVISKNFFLKWIAQKVNEELITNSLSENTKDESCCVDDEVEFNLLLEEIEKIISMLPPARQNVYRMRYIEHLTQKKIASRLNISENTVESHLKQSSKFIRFMLRPYKDSLN